MVQGVAEVGKVLATQTIGEMPPAWTQQTSQQLVANSMESLQPRGPLPDLPAFPSPERPLESVGGADPTPALHLADRLPDSPPDTIPDLAAWRPERKDPDATD